MVKATFGAGCFWGVQEAFDKVEGVLSTAVGFMGGITKNPTYEQVCAGNTGHIEAVQLEYDPNKISYDELLNIFWKIQDPSSKDKQGEDIGFQYRSVIFYHTDKQKSIAEVSKIIEKKRSKKKILTAIVPAAEFYPAEEYHQHYLRKKEI